MATIVNLYVEIDQDRPGALDRRDEIVAVLRAAGLRWEMTDSGLDVYLFDGPPLHPSEDDEQDREVAEEFAVAVADEIGTSSRRGALETLPAGEVIDFGPGPKFGKPANQARIVLADGRHLVAMCWIEDA